MPPLTASGRHTSCRRGRGPPVSQPVDDDHYVVVQLDFASVDQATAFRGFLETQVWSTPASSPGLAGSPRAVVLEAVDQRVAHPGAHEA